MLIIMTMSNFKGIFKSKLKNFLHEPQYWVLVHFCHLFLSILPYPFMLLNILLTYPTHICLSCCLVSRRKKTKGHFLNTYNLPSFYFIYCICSKDFFLTTTMFQVYLDKSRKLQQEVQVNPFPR